MTVHHSVVVANAVLVYKMRKLLSHFIRANFPSFAFYHAPSGEVKFTPSRRLKSTRRHSKSKSGQITITLGRVTPRSDCGCRHTLLLAYLLYVRVYFQIRKRKRSRSEWND